MEILENSWISVGAGEYKYPIEGSMLMLTLGSLERSWGEERFCDLSLESPRGSCDFCLVHYPEGRSIERFFPYVLVKPEHLPILDRARALKGLKQGEQDQLEELVLQTKAFLTDIEFI